MPALSKGHILDHIRTSNLQCIFVLEDYFILATSDTHCILLQLIFVYLVKLLS